MFNFRIIISTRYATNIKSLHKFAARGIYRNLPMVCLIFFLSRREEGAQYPETPWNHLKTIVFTDPWKKTILRIFMFSFLTISNNLEAIFKITTGVTLNKARALYLVRVSELHVKSITKLIGGKRGGVKKSYIRKLPLVLYKIDRKGFQKLQFTLTDPKHAHYYCYWNCYNFLFGRP